MNKDIACLQHLVLHMSDFPELFNLDDSTKAPKPIHSPFPELFNLDESVGGA
jgi:hypothetical protein